MDNLAHTLVGAALGEAGLRRRTPRGLVTLLIAVNLPDVDVVAVFTGDSLGVRRRWTHGILAIALWPVILTGLVLAWDRWVRLPRNPEADPVLPRELFLLSFIGVLSHPILDWLNSYGLRWLMPFDGSWFYGDALFIVDPWIWIGLILCIWMFRRGFGKQAGRVMLTTTGCYIALMLISSFAGESLVERGMRIRGFDLEEVMVGPVPVNPNRRDVVMRRGDRYLLGTLNWLPRPRLSVSPRVIHSNANHPAAVEASRRPEARQFLNWSRFPIYRIEETGDGYLVTIDDLRYSDGVERSWAAIDLYIGDASPLEPLEMALSPAKLETVDFRSAL